VWDDIVFDQCWW